MNIQQIVYAVEVEKLHSFSAAAQSLYISQPRLSQAIRNLEKELGFEIFERNRKGMSGTTVKGYEFLSQARKVLKQFSYLETFKQTSSPSFHLSTTLISQAQNAFLTLCNHNISCKDLDFDMFFCGCYETADRIKNLNADLGIVTILSNQKSDWLSYFAFSKIKYQELLCSKCHITIHKDSELTRKELISPKDLKGYTYITEKCSRMNHLTLQVYSLFDSLCPNTKITVSNTDIMYQLVSNNKAFSLDCLPLDQKSCERYSLVSVPLDTHLRVHLGYLISSQISINSYSKDYLSILSEELAPLKENKACELFV